MSMVISRARSGLGSNYNPATLLGRRMHKYHIAYGPLFSRICACDHDTYCYVLCLYYLLCALYGDRQFDRLSVTCMSARFWWYVIATPRLTLSHQIKENNNLLPKGVMGS
jgi:hypothetical protein